MLPLISTMTCVPVSSQSYSINLNFGSSKDIICNNRPSPVLALYKQASVQRGFDYGPRQTRAERVDNARRLAAWPSHSRQWVCASQVLLCLVTDARRAGRVVRWVCGGKSKDVMTAKNVVEICDMAKAVEGEDDLWLVSEGPGISKIE